MRNGEHSLLMLCTQTQTSSGESDLRERKALQEDGGYRIGELCGRSLLWDVSWNMRPPIAVLTLLTPSTVSPTECIQSRAGLGLSFFLGASHSH